MSRAYLRRGRRGRSLDGSPAAPDSPSTHLSPSNRTRVSAAWTSPRYQSRVSITTATAMPRRPVN